MFFGDSIRYVWMSGQDGVGRVYMGTMHRTTKQVGYTGVVHMDPNGYSQNYPVIAGNGDEFMIVWEHAAGGDNNVQYVTSTTGTVGVSAPQNAHANSSGSQVNPDVVYANGTYHVVWSDDLNGTVAYRTASFPVVEMDIDVKLQGPYDAGSGLMDDALRTLAGFPLVEPFTPLGFTHYGEGGGETISPGVLAVSGNDAIVDWILVELRDKNDHSIVLNTRSALLQRDGDVVDLDGSSSLGMAVADDSYYVAVRHRNHLPVLTANTVSLSAASTASLDLSNPSTMTYGTDAQVNSSGVNLLWAGNAIADQVIKYTGSANDRDRVLIQVGGSIPTNTFAGYTNEDLNLDGIVKYTGSSNDRDLILVNIGGSVPTNTRLEQLP